MNRQQKPRYFGILDVKKGYLHKAAIGYLMAVKCRIFLTKLFEYPEGKIKVVEITQKCYEGYYDPNVHIPGFLYFINLEEDIVKDH